MVPVAPFSTRGRQPPKRTWREKTTRSPACKLQGDEDRVLVGGLHRGASLPVGVGPQNGQRFGRAEGGVDAGDVITGRPAGDAELARGGVTALPDAEEVTAADGSREPIALAPRPCQVPGFSRACPPPPPLPR